VSTRTPGILVRLWCVGRQINY